MDGWIVFAFFLTLILLGRLAVPEARLAGGILIMGAGIWLIWISAVHPSHVRTFVRPPDFVPLLLGVWLVVKGALRLASY
jgi:hypothetical protein